MKIPKMQISNRYSSFKIKFKSSKMKTKIVIRITKHFFIVPFFVKTMLKIVKLGNRKVIVSKAINEISKRSKNFLEIERKNVYNFKHATQYGKVFITKNIKSQK
ncbi:hypothetical protein [Borreliella valaisiana]|uniref:hypothetical protein n=1 Tax=Borreliella valaisiana TaxID=62088 RepID=UPI003BA21AA7